MTHTMGCKGVWQLSLGLACYRGFCNVVGCASPGRSQELRRGRQGGLHLPRCTLPARGSVQAPGLARVSKLRRAQPLLVRTGHLQFSQETGKQVLEMLRGLGPAVTASEHVWKETPVFAWNAGWLI